MNNVGMSNGEIKGYMLVLNKDGMPKVEFPELVPDHVWKSFTQEQKDFVNNSVQEDLKRFD